MIFSHYMNTHQFKDALNVLQGFNTDLEKFINLHRELSPGRTAPIQPPPESNSNSSRLKKWVILCIAVFGICGMVSTVIFLGMKNPSENSKLCNTLGLESVDFRKFSNEGVQDCCQCFQAKVYVPNF